VTLPDFLIIGAPKAGTTWLVSCLQLHPEVFIPRHEIHYWTRHASKVDAAHTWYRRHFAAAKPGQLIGENSNTYLTQSEVAPQIAAALPEARLIIMLRNPIDRAYSGYCMALRYGDATDDVNLYLDPQRSPSPQILRNSLYYVRLQPYFAAFPPERLHFIVFDDILDKQSQVLAELYRFLQIGAPTANMLLAEKVNSKERTWPSPSLHRLWKISGTVGALSHHLRGTRLHGLLRRALTRPVVYPSLPPTLRHTLAEYFRADIQRLSDHIGRDLTAWVDADRLR
jgi:hypothetical protein